MTAKHRKGKSNHKHEEDHGKSEIPESEVRTGGNSYTLVLFACLVVVVGVATGAWFYYQQHQTLTHLTDTITGMQMKVAKLQASQETMRQTSDKVRVSDDVEGRINALEESYALAQKQVDEALATTEQLKTSDLPAQVLSLHTEMKSRLAEIQQTTVSVEQMSQLQARLQKPEELEQIGLQVEGLATSSADLSKQVQAVMGRLEEAEAILDDVATLTDNLKQETARLSGLEVQLKSYQTEMATIRELLLNEHAEQLDMEELISALRMSIQKQNSASHSRHAELKAQLDNLQWQVNQMVGHAETVEQAEGTPARVIEEEDAVSEAEAAESDSDEPVQEVSDDDADTEQMEQSLTSPETVTEKEEPSLEGTLNDEDELLLDDGDAKLEDDDYDHNDESIVDAEQDESDEEEFGNEVEV
ncbi:myosin heavy chain, skeletal muscle [Syngnathus scovelli]|uniref:myosin heavy chain, skeletal muscle n=1 Tax=Syngnathus scovelli TaxID=161590 RepID=UPI00210F6D15|nr:myosin-13 isoform X1 [Syngnathus scovelli]